MALRPLILSLLLIVNGCAPAGFPKTMYSGDFRAVNLSDHTIIMKECTGFGFASPEAGTLIPNAPKGRHFPLLSEFPTRTTIHWHAEFDGKNQEQTVDLTEVVPRGVDGETLFEFGKDQKWTVRFEPKMSKSPD